MKFSRIFGSSISSMRFSLGVTNLITFHPHFQNNVENPLHDSTQSSDNRQNLTSTSADLTSASAEGTPVVSSSNCFRRESFHRLLLKPHFSSVHARFAFVDRRRLAALHPARSWRFSRTRSIRYHRCLIASYLEHCHPPPKQFVECGRCSQHQITAKTSHLIATAISDTRRYSQPSIQLRSAFARPISREARELC